MLLRRLRRAVLLSAALLLAAAGAVAAQGNQRVDITFLNVGQGDAVLVRSPEGQTALIDAGPGMDLAPILRSRGVKQIDLLVASHAHADHIGGMTQVIEAMPVRYFMDNGLPYTTATYLHLLEVLRRRKEITYLNATSRTLGLGAVQVEVLPFHEGENDQNNQSVALLVRFGRFTALLSGDSERRELSWLTANGLVPKVTVLKAPHHGSDNGFTLEFLHAALPEVVVISVGPNSYGHPRPEALAAYGATAAQVYRTDQDGEITISGYEDGRFEVIRSGGNTSLVPTATEPRATAPPPMRPPPAGRPSASQVEISVFADAPGNDNRNPNGEYATLTSHSTSDLSLAGWMLCDAVRHCYRFPQGSVIRAASRVVVYTGSGVSDGTQFFMGSGQAVWNNDGDTATLYDAEGRVVGTYTYD